MARMNLDNSDPEKDFNDKLKAIIQTDTGTEEPEEEQDDAQEEFEDDEEDGLREIDVDEDESVDDEEEPVLPVKSHKTSKEQAAIIRLKNQVKELKAIVTSKTAQEQQKLENSQREALIHEYMENGYEEPQATKMAEKDLKILAIERKIESTTFKINNAKLFDKYPQAESEIDRIMSIMNSTGLSAEQACVALYHTPEIDRRERAKAAVTGQLKQRADNGISSATRTSTAIEEPTLSRTDRRNKAEFERKFGQISDERFLELKEKYSI